MTAPDPDLDLPADALPPELVGLVTLGHDGSLTYTRTTPTPERALKVGGIAVGVAALVLNLLFVLGVLSTGDLALDVLRGALVLPFIVGFSWLALRQVVEVVVVSRTGIGGTFGFAWTPADQLSLKGDLGTGRIRLEHVDRDGQRSMLREWGDVRSTREKGWDVDSIRWFAQRVAALGGVPLTVDVPADAQWREIDAARTALSHEESTRMEPPYTELLSKPLQWPEEEWGPDRVAIRIRGTSPALLLGTAPVSYHAGHLVHVDPDGVTIGESLLPLSRIHGVRPWFGRVPAGKHTAEVGEVRALTERGHRVLVQRRLSEVEPGVVLGAAASIANAVERARTAEKLEIGDASEVPEALRQVAARGTPELRARDAGQARARDRD